MFKLQQEVNKRVTGDNWYEKKHPWHLAAIEETVELLDSLKWKWWNHTKHEDVDWDNIYIELADLMAFTLSYVIENNIDALEGLPEAFASTAESSILLLTQEQLSAEQTVHLKDISLRYLGEASKGTLRLDNLLAMIAVSMSYKKFYKIFVGKAMLNIFRQDNGYKEGTYMKHWGDKEDNVYMAKIVAETPIEVLVKNPQVVYDGLKEAYAAQLAVNCPKGE
jgi:NTP pyrophosphatase (non-canonical NTP hydrolase)